MFVCDSCRFNCFICLFVYLSFSSVYAFLLLSWSYVDCSLYNFSFDFVNCWKVSLYFLLKIFLSLSALDNTWISFSKLILWLLSLLYSVFITSCSLYNLCNSLLVFVYCCDSCLFVWMSDDIFCYFSSLISFSFYISCAMNSILFKNCVFYYKYFFSRYFMFNCDVFSFIYIFYNKLLY